MGVEVWLLCLFEKMACDTISIDKNYLIYGNGMLFLATTNKLIFITPHQRLPYFFHLSPFEVAWFLSPLLHQRVHIFHPPPPINLWLPAPFCK